MKFLQPFNRFFSRLWKKPHPVAIEAGLTVGLDSRASQPGFKTQELSLVSVINAPKQAGNLTKPANTSELFNSAAAVQSPIQNSLEKNSEKIVVVRFDQSPKLETAAEAYATPAAVVAKPKIRFNQPELKPKLSHQISEAIEEYLLALKLNHCSRATLRNYRSDIKQFCDFAQENDLKQILTKPKLLEFAQAETDRGLQPNSVKRKLVSIAQFSAWARKGRLITDQRLMESLDRAETPDLVKFAAPEKTQPVVSSPAESTPARPLEAQSPKSQPEVSQLAPVKSTANLPTSQWPKLKFPKPPGLPDVLVNRWLPYFNLLVLVVFLTGLGIFTYQQFRHSEPAQAYPTTLTRPSRALSFQGRLTNTGDSPIVGATPMRFKLFGEPGATTLLWDSNACSIDPDVDGVFSANLGSGAGGGADTQNCGAEIGDHVFANNSNVWLQVTVNGETLSPLQPIQTVAYALNAETLQGYPASPSAVENTIPVMNNSGEIVLGNTYPKILSTGTTMTLEGKAVTIQSTSGSGTDVALISDKNITLDAGLGGLVNATDLFRAPGATLSANYAGSTALTLNAGPSATADIATWKTSVGTVLGRISKDGQIAVGNITPEQDLNVANNLQLGTTDGTRYIYFDNGTANNAGIRYDSTSDKVQFSNDGSVWADIGTGVGNVTSVSNSDGTLTISPTAGAVVASLDLTHANTWTGLQTLNNTYTDFAQYLRHAGDTNTYLDFTADKLDTTIGGKTLLSLDTNAVQNLIKIGDGTDVDTQILANASATGLFVEGSSGNVGIGDTTPASLFTVGSGDLFQVDTAGDIVKLKNLTYSWPNSHVSGGFLIDNGSGVLSWTTTVPATSLGFSGLSGGTNTTAAMIVGTGATLSYAGTGTIDASSLVGATWIAPGAIGSATPNAATFTDLSTTGNTTIGNAGADTTTVNSAAWTFANDTNLALSGGVNGLSFDTDTLSVDATNHSVGIGTTTPGAKLDIIGGTVTTNRPIINGTETWNDVATSFYGMKLNITNTAAAATSRILSVQKNGTPVYEVDKDGRMLIQGVNGNGVWVSGTPAALAYPLMMLSSTSNNAVFSTSGTYLGINSGAAFTGDLMHLAANGTSKMLVTNAGLVGIGTTGPDAELDVLSTTEQLRLTYTDGSVYSSSTVDSSGNLTIDNTGTKTIIADDLQVTGGDILDSNGNESIRFGTTATAVNEVTLTNAAANGTVTIAATGDDADIALSIDAKGSDALNLNGTGTGDILIGGGAGSTGCTIANATGTLTCTAGVTAANAPFAGLVSGTNTTAAMIVGSGATLSYIGTGTIDASSLTGGTWATPGTIGSTTANTGAFTSLTSSGNSTLGTGGASANTLGAGAGSTNVIGSTTNPGALTLHGATTLDNTFNVSNGTLAVTAPSTTGNAAAVTADSLTTGSALNLTSASTTGGASGVSKMLNIARSGANAQLAHTAYGVYSAVTDTNVTSGTNIAGYFSASGATTANYGLLVAAGNVGIGTTSPVTKLDVVGSYSGRFSYDKTSANGSGNQLFGKASLLQLTGDGTVNNGPNIGMLQLNIGNAAVNQSATEIYLAATRGTTETSRAAVANNDILGQIGFFGDDGTDIRSRGAIIQSYVDTTNAAVATQQIPAKLLLATSNNAPITFNTNVGAIRSGIAPITAGERMRIDGAGNVGIGDTTPASLLTVGNGDLFQVDTAGDIVKLKNLTYSWPSAQVTGGFLINDGSGGLTWTTSIAATSLPFSGLTSATNTTAAMIVDTGATLNYTGTGTINASSLVGATWAAPGTIGSTTANSGAFTSLTSSGNSTLGTGASSTNTFGAGASSINTIGAVTNPGILTLHGATTLDNTFTVSGANLTSLGGNLTVSGTAWTATPTISGAVTMTSGFDSNAASTVAGLTVDTNGNLSVTNGTLSVISPNNTGDAAAVTANSLTTGNALNLTSTSTVGGVSGLSKMLNIARSGINTQIAHSAYGVYSSVTNTNVTSGTNIAGYFSASGAATANYGLLVAAGNVGIGTITPGATLAINGGVHIGGDSDPGNDNLLVDGNATVTGETYLNGTLVSGDSKTMLKYSGTSLELNSTGDFTDGIWIGNSNLRGGTGKITLGGTIGGGGSAQITLDGSNGYLDAKQFRDTNSSTYLLEPASTGTSINIAGNIAMATGKSITGTNLIFGSSAATVNIGSSLGNGTLVASKVTATTIDPPYWINGQKYATFVPSMVGLKEEMTSTVKLQATDNPKLYKYVIDFDNLTEGSQMWLFSRVIDLDPAMENLTVLLSSDSDAKVFYKKDLARRQLIFFGTAPAEISYRLTALRFDHAQWPHTATDQDPFGLRPDTYLLGNTQSDANSVSDAQLLAALNQNSDFTLDQLGNMQLTVALNSDQTDANVILKDDQGQIIEKLAALSQAVIGKLKVGFIQTNHLSADSIAAPIANFETATIQKITTQEVTSQVITAQTASISGTSKLGALLATTASISGELTAEKITAPVASFSSGRIAYLESRMAELETAKVSSFEAMNATVSGTLYAANIADFDAKVAASFKQPSLVASLFGQVPATPTPVVTGATEIASSAAQIKQTLAQLNLSEADVVINPSAVFVKTYFEVAGNSHLAGNVGVGGNLIIGDGLKLSGNELAYQPTQGGETVFKIQPSGLGRLELMAGRLTITEAGAAELHADLRVAGATTLDGNLEVTGQTTLRNKLMAHGDIELIDSSGHITTTIATSGAITTTQDVKAKNITASGIGSFSSLKLASDNLISSNSGSGSGTVTALQTTGKARLASGQTELTIKSELLNSETLIYITPNGSTGNQVLFVKAQTPENTSTPDKEGEFKVGVDQPLSQDVDFTWWLVN